MKTLLDRNIDGLVSEPPELGCVLYIPGLPGGNTKIYDRSPYGNHGAITGATWVRLPSGLWCLSFDGSDDYVGCGSGSSLDITGALTMEVWIYATAFTAGYPCIMAKRINDNIQYQLFLGTNDKLRLGGTAGDESADTGAALAIEKWYRVAVTYSDADNEVCFYKNGLIELMNSLRVIRWSTNTL